MACEFSLQTQAYFDAEVDAISATVVESHVADCAECQCQLQNLGRLRASLRREVGYVRTPAALRARVLASLDGETGSDSPVRLPREIQRPRRAFSLGLITGLTGAAMAVGLAMFTLSPPRLNVELDSIVSAHLSSMMPEHLIDVVSTDRHTVKPWFASNADVSPVVADFETKGYRLIGGRADYLNKQRAAVIVYRHGAHIINVFSWSNDKLGTPRDAMRNGYHMAFWNDGNLAYCAVSDADWDAVLELKGLMLALSSSESHP